MDKNKHLQRHPIWHMVRSILIGVLVVVIAIGIVIWTRSLRQKDQLERQREVLADVLDREGELGLLELAGVTVNDIFYGEQGVSVFLGDMSAYSYSAEEMRNIAIYELANKSVVHITTVSIGLNTFLEVLPVQGTGSGIIISEDGYILTNAHVVQNAAQLHISMHDGANYEASLVGMDVENDLAVLKVELPPQVLLDPITIGTASTLKVGQKVVAIGNPFGYDRTMTIGTVSGLGRPVRTENNTVINGMIQTDAAINPGNSGGPLLNSRGEMVGICTTIHSTTGGSQGIGFAVPVDTAISVIPDLIKFGKVMRGWLDITMVQLDPSIVEYADLPVSGGLLVSQVRPGGKAEKGGLKGGTQRVQYGSAIIYLGGDVIVEVHGEPVSEYADLYSALVDTHPGETVEVVVIRKGEKKVLQVELVERPEGMEWTVR
ncbi:S1C family serine protease [Pleomorphochaeta sp. DL1XJH-081]|uniref:S1C family serine protease n=1 Tax=Pleomorphochaeta sp. DL1XJH-081 TaxID=3409690 RepID=UPI003BB6C7EE